MEQPSVLEDIWFYILGYILALYVMLDGFDLGAGILSLFAGKENRRSVMMTSLSTVWDANEVWLVIWGGALFGAFPLAYATALNALYVPVMVMLFSLIFRGISFEFHGQSVGKSRWSNVFGIGSLIAATAQGTILGGTLSGIKVNEQGMFAGGLFDWAHYLTLIVIIEVLTGYMMLGSTYLTMKTTGSIQYRNRIVAMATTLISLVLAGMTAFVIPVINKSLAEKLLLDGHRKGLIVVFGASVLCFGMLLFSLFSKRDRAAFIWSELVFLTTFSGLWVAVFPWLLPGAVTVSMAASSQKTLIFMLLGIGPIIPVVTVYNFYVYRVFRGKVGDSNY
jgi:cytochrome d ubiquinol oxidase subunit II